MSPESRLGDPGAHKRLRRRKRAGSVFQSLTLLSVLVGMAALAALLINVATNGRLIVAMHSFTSGQGVTLSLESIFAGADVTPFVVVAKILDDAQREKGEPWSVPQERDVLIFFLGKPIQRLRDIWFRIQAASAAQLGSAELRWIPKQERLFGKLSNVRDEEGNRYVRVEEVRSGSPAEQAGLQAGDVITHVNSFPVPEIQLTSRRKSPVWVQIVYQKLQDPSLAPATLTVQRDDTHVQLELSAVLSEQRSYKKRPLAAIWHFVTHFDSRYPEIAGILSAIYGSIFVVGLTALFAFPLGVGAALYLEEYAPQGRLTNFIQVNIANLAGVPSVVYGIIGLEIIARGAGLFAGFGRSILTGGLTLTLLVLPIVIISAREAIRAVPSSIREAAYAVGATRWQAICHHVLPCALPGIFTGVILALSRAIGETAPLILIGAFQYVPFLPRGLFDVFTVIPIQIFSWISLPQDGYPNLAAAAILVLLGIMLGMNALAIILRNRLQRRW